MLPMATGTIVPLAILNAISIWNDYFTPYLYLKSKPTLAVGLQSMVNQMEYNANWVMMDELFNIESRPVVGHREYDADGDAVFAAEFRPTDFSGMFRNCNNFDLSRLD